MRPEGQRSKRPAEEAAGGIHAERGRAPRSSGKKMVGPAAKREAVAHLRNAFEMSERRACSVIAADRTMIRYRSIRPDDRCLARPPARACPGASPVRLSTAVHPAAARRGVVRDHPHLPALPRGRAGGAQAPHSAQGRLDRQAQRADPGGGQAQRPLVAGFRP